MRLRTFFWLWGLILIKNWAINLKSTIICTIWVFSKSFWFLSDLWRLCLDAILEVYKCWRWEEFWWKIPKFLAQSANLSLVIDVSLFHSSYLFNFNQVTINNNLLRYKSLGSNFLKKKYEPKVDILAVRLIRSVGSVYFAKVLKKHLELFVSNCWW